MSWKKALKVRVEEHLKGYKACHDFYHALRVLHYAKLISKEIECDLEVLYAAALLHDVGYKNNEHDDKNHHKYSMKLARIWLKEVNFPVEKIESVLEVIRLHDNHAWGTHPEPTEDIETKIIQDADRIEGIGAVGVARVAYFFGEKGYPIYNPDPVPETKEVWLDHSLLDQFPRDYLKKWQNMNYDYSREISRKRQKYIEKYYQELKSELLELG